MVAGTRDRKLSQNGKNPRPAGLDPTNRHINSRISSQNFARVIMRKILGQPNKNLYKIHKLKPKGLGHERQRELGSTFSATLSSKPKAYFLEIMHPFVVVLVQWRAEGPGRPASPRPPSL